MGTADLSAGRTVAVAAVRKSRAALLLSILGPVLAVIWLAASPRHLWLLGPIAFICSSAAVIVAVLARREVASVYARGEHAFQPVEHELLSARTTTAWALSFGLPAIPFEVVFTLAILLFTPSF